MALTADQRRALETAARAAIAYREADHDRPVRPPGTPNEILRGFDGPIPENGLPESDVVERLINAAEPGLMTKTNPRFHGWVMGASHPAGVAADWLTSAWGQVPGFFENSPAGSASEQVAGNWLVDILGLPLDAGVGLTTGATMANFTAMAVARTALLDGAGWDTEENGLFGAPEVQVVLGGEAHSSVFLTLRLLGFGASRVHVAEADGEGRVRPEALEAVLGGLSGPVLVCLQAGNVNSGAFDPFEPLIAAAKQHGAWVHVDGAFGLWAAASPALGGLTAGLDGADSWAADAHKWLQVPYDCGVAIVRNRAAMERAMGIQASYLPDRSKRNPSDYSPEMSRRARGFALWSVLMALGRNGVTELVDRHCRLARLISEKLSGEPGIEVLNEVCLNQVLVACGPATDTRADGWTKKVLETVQADGICYPSAGRWRGRDVIRISVCSGNATEDDASATAGNLIEAWRDVRTQSGSPK